jgi:Spy/CpxP family protein refolding chaperone
MEEVAMTRIAAALVAASLVAAMPAPAQRAPSGTEGGANSVESVRQAMRSDKRGLVERNMQLTAQEAAKFWPLYDTYQQELDRVIQRENRALLDYIHAENMMTDANAKRIAREVLRAEGEEQNLREKQLRRMLAVLPGRKAVRYLQIETKLRTLQRYDVAEQIPLVR